MKKSQVTIFFILGLVILILTLTTIYITSNLNKDNLPGIKVSGENSFELQREHFEEPLQELELEQAEEIIYNIENDFIEESQAKVNDYFYYLGTDDFNFENFEYTQTPRGKSILIKRQDGQIRPSVEDFERVFAEKTCELLSEDINEDINKELVNMNCRIIITPSEIRVNYDYSVELIPFDQIVDKSISFNINHDFGELIEIRNRIIQDLDNEEYFNAYPLDYFNLEMQDDMILIELKKESWMRFTYE